MFIPPRKSGFFSFYYRCVTLADGKAFPLGAASLSAASGGYSEGAVCAAVDKIEGKRKPEDFIGHRKRKGDRVSGG